jgi:hypothetical protein
LIDNIAARFSARSISKALGGAPSAVTIEKYLAMVKEAYLLEQLSAFSPKSKDRIKSERKPYAIDTGFVAAKSQGVFPLLGKQLENSVYLALRRQGHTPQNSLYFYRGEEGREVDFLVRQGHRTTRLIQVCLDLSSIESKERETKALLAAHKEHPQAELIIVTANESGIASITANIKATLIPAWQFCMQ